MRYKYEEVTDLLKKRIYSGVYKTGEKLPSIQMLSVELHYNADTIVKAYKSLEQQHLVYAVPKSGYYVMKNEPERSGARNVIDLLNVHMPDNIDPYKDFTHCMDQAIALYGKKLFEYSSPKGMPELLQTLCGHLANFQVFTKQENIFITNGSQQALYILSAMPFHGAGSKVLVEQPTYSVMLKILANARVPVLGIRRTLQGLDLDELEAIFKSGDIKFFYTMPRYQNPTGYSYSATQKKDILRLAQKYHVFIVEDDYLADLALDKKADPMYAYAKTLSDTNEDQCIYIGSFSKTLLPGLRLGMAVLPGKLQQQFQDFKYSIDLNTSILAQGALEIFLKSSMYRFHVKRTREYYRNKMEVLRQSCSNENNDSIAWHIPETGLYAYMESEEIPSRALEARLLDSKVLVKSTDNSYLQGFVHTEGIRLCVCNASDEDIRNAVQIIRTRCHR